MYPTRIKLPPQADIQATIDQLNRLVLSLHDLSRCCKHAHLNLKGDNFYEFHLLYEDFAGALLDEEDKIAEIIVSIGGLATVFCGQTVENTVCHMMPADAVDGKELLNHILECHGEINDYLDELVNALIEANIQLIANEVMGTQAVIQKQMYKLQGFAA
jgi:starvation-inducible DNA-binding protein